MNMHNIVLVHGAWHQTSCFKILNDLSYPYLNLFTPSLVQNIDFRQVSMSTYISILSKQLSAIKGPVILVGHSFAGIVISEIANIMPDKIKSLIYLNALIPQKDDSLFSLTADFEYQYLTPFLNINETLQSIYIHPLENINAYMYQLSDASRISSDFFRAEPLQPLSHPYSGKRHQIPARAIISKHDLCIKDSDQIKMCQKQHIDWEVIDSDHCPFVSNPLELIQTILKDL